ncbi:MAG TPA: hypothetical protein PLL18_14890, partial [Flavobacteriales bacterium]|nr:hypothetical protein [Flavobacteriales bacterium]
GIGGTISGPSPVAGVQALDERIPASPTDVVVRRTDRAVIVSWRDPWSGDRGIAWAQVERAVGDGADFQPVNKQALEPGILAYVDSTAMPGLAYRYRVVGVSLTGTRGLPSQPVSLGALPAGADAPRLLNAARTKDGISLTWAGRERQGRSFKLYRSVEGGEPKLLKDLPVNAEGYTDTAPVRGALNLYLLRMVLPDGTESTWPMRCADVRKRKGRRKRGGPSVPARVNPSLPQDRQALYHLCIQGRPRVAPRSFRRAIRGTGCVAGTTEPVLRRSHPERGQADRPILNAYMY